MALAYRRPILLASYNQTAVVAPINGQAIGPEARPEKPSPTLQPTLRTDFPAADTIFEGGYSDGYCYRSTFATGKRATTYQLIKQFLVEQGYANVPVPADVDELIAFRLPPRLRHQLSLFGEDGYVHNPVKILFPPPGGRRGALILEVYNETAPDHLLRFHRRK